MEGLKTNTFTYEYPVKQSILREGSRNHLPAELAKVGKTVMLALMAEVRLKELKSTMKR